MDGNLREKPPLSCREVGNESAATVAQSAQIIEQSAQLCYVGYTMAHAHGMRAAPLNEVITWALVGTGIFGIGHLGLNFVVAKREPEWEKLDGRRGW